MFPAIGGFATGDFSVKIDSATSVMRRKQYVEVGIGRTVKYDDDKGMPDGVKDARGTRFSGVFFENENYQEPLLILETQHNYKHKHYQKYSLSDLPDFKYLIDTSEQGLTFFRDYRFEFIDLTLN